ncbi:uncharacterized protein LOC131882530 isoform X2 [Tigriopus californicus]|nr:uncharacterized protein LOC131882530 isoform X2 [Tigriopus californicus]
MRVYFELDHPESRAGLCRIACQEPKLDICDISTTSNPNGAHKLYPLVWRFLPLLDRQVDWLFSRDLDSMITSREQSAILEFMNRPDKSFHTMRDHPNHQNKIMGGLWGVKLINETFRSQMEEAFMGLLTDPVAYRPRTKRGADQFLLMRHIWKLVQGKPLLSHDSYSCGKYNDTIGFPTPRKRQVANNFVGAVLEMNLTLDIPCPINCRRMGHPDWTYC